MSDLIERLRRDDGFGSYDLRKQAANRIEELEAKVQAQSDYIMISNRVNNNLKKQLKEGE